MSQNQSNPQITCSGLWKVFGPNPEKILQNLDPSLSRAEVQEQTGHVIAVKDVSFEVQEGETFVVMGLSGSGKSTLVRCISRLVEPTKGNVLIDRDDVMAMSERQLIELRRHRMSMVFQHFGLLPHRRVIENIGYGLEVRGMARREREIKANEVLDMVGLQGWGNHYPRELSGGMQQRVGLARALAVDPEIMLFDEPFSALDPLIRRDMQDELLKLQSVVRKTMVFITHDFLEAIKMGDHIAIMKDGEFVQIGTPEEIVANPADDYVRDFSVDVPRHKVLSVKSIMKADWCRCEPEESVGTSLQKMEQHKSQIAYAVDSKGTYLGTLSHDRVIGVDHSKPTKNFTIEQRTASPSDLIESLIVQAARSSDSIPVVDAENHLIGCVDQKSILFAIEGSDVSLT
jgi:glycine betaine/proline transport system ATP-binding protein